MDGGETDVARQRRGARIQPGGPKRTNARRGADPASEDQTKSRSSAARVRRVSGRSGTRRRTYSASYSVTLGENERRERKRERESLKEYVRE